jgi:hypothetical protein
MGNPLLLLELYCPGCQAPLTNGEHVILAAHVASTDQNGEVRLSAVFGDSRVESDLTLGEGAMVTYACPSCERSLTVDTPCKFCGGPLASANLPTGEAMEFCGREGCRGRVLGGYGDVDEMTDLLNRMFKIPHD